MTRLSNESVRMLRDLFAKHAENGATIFHQAHAEELLALAEEVIAMRSENAAPQPSTATINATVPSQEGVGQGDAAAAAPSDDKQYAEAERIAWDTIKQYGCHVPERDDVKLAKAFLATLHPVVPSAVAPLIPDAELLLDNAACASQVRELLRDDEGEETVLREAVRRGVYEPLAKLLRMPSATAPRGSFAEAARFLRSTTLAMGRIHVDDIAKVQEYFADRFEQMAATDSRSAHG